ncbi:hypothetical protein [Streptomyces turgidiscabies]|uniref:hypothetical protein n=1 Tax=Streptomyces turgidiscabies TaxID=85558 RepID=UPI0038F7E56F
MSTVTESAAPAGELTHAAALTKADVDALEAFLSARFDAMRSANHFSSDAYNAAAALARVLRDLVKPVRASFRYDHGSPELLRARMRHWNRLRGLAEPWENTDGYDRGRWDYLVHLDASEVASSAEYARRREEEQAAYERDRLLRSL